MINKKGQWEVEKEAWGVLDLVWPKPGMTGLLLCRSTLVYDTADWLIQIFSYLDLELQHIPLRRKRESI